MIGSALQTIGRPQKRSNEVVRYPAPISGMDIRKAVGADDLQHCVYTFNLCPFEYGLRVRKGYREWQIDVDAGVGSGVHTLIPFDSVRDGGVGDKLFAVTNEGIWDVSILGDTPLPVATFGNQTPDAGYGTFTHYVNQAEEDVLFYADNINGLWSYDGALETWTTGGVISGGSDITDADVKFVMSHKNNVWFAAHNSTVGYYLPILSNTGGVTAQHFGDKFKHGGTLEGLFSWTIDGGDGVDDILVVASHAGDVILYTGSGPDETDWGMKGIYFIGEIPDTPRFGTEQGGELHLLSAYGLTSMNDLLKGVNSAALRADIDGNGMAYKIAGLIREKMKETISQRGWDVALVPTEGGVLISTPTVGSSAPIQYYYNLATRGWGIWRDVPMECFTEWEGAIFIGTADNRVMKMDVSVDNVLLNPVDPTLNGDNIKFSILSSYSSMGVDGVYKRVKLIRPDFLSNIEPTHSSLARYDYSINEGSNFRPSEPVPAPFNSWDVGIWDTAVWGAGAPTTFPTIGGGWGYGRYIAIATAGSSRTDTRLIGWDIIFDVGGPLL